MCEIFSSKTNKPYIIVVNLMNVMNAMNLKHVYNSIFLNYKSWTMIFLSIYFLERENYVCAIGTFFIMMFLAYYVHYCSHSDCWFPYNLTHIEHHNHANWVSHSIEILLECSIFIVALFVKNVLGLHFLNEWIILYFYLFYTTVHNINYSIFHVNGVHEKHHELINFNYGPDIFDIIFNTKKNPDSDLENTDHYIWNILVLTPLIAFIKYIYQNSSYEYKILGTCISGMISIIILLVLIFSSADLYIESSYTRPRSL